MTLPTLQQGMNMLHCAAQNNHVNILQFIQDTLDGYKVDAGDKVPSAAVHITLLSLHVICHLVCSLLLKLSSVDLFANVDRTGYLRIGQSRQLLS